MRIAGLVVACALGACAFSSQDALFDDSDAAQPIADGARFAWIAPNEAPMDVTFRREGATYAITQSAHADEPMTGVLLVPVPETPQADYIVQWRDENDREGRVYAFMWPVEDGYRVYADPDAFEDQNDGPKRADAFCVRRAYGECMFTSRSNLLAYYQAIVYPALSSGAVSAENALVLTPLTGAAQPGKPD